MRSCRGRGAGRALRPFVVLSLLYFLRVSIGVHMDYVVAFGFRLWTNVRVLGPPELCIPTASFTVSGIASFAVSTMAILEGLESSNGDERAKHRGEVGD